MEWPGGGAVAGRLLGLGVTDFKNNNRYNNNDFLDYFILLFLRVLCMLVFTNLYFLSWNIFFYHGIYAFSYAREGPCMRKSGWSIDEAFISPLLGRYLLHQKC